MPCTNVNIISSRTCQIIFILAHTIFLKLFFIFKSVLRKENSLVTLKLF